MHAYDPAVVAALDAWTEIGEHASFVRSSIYLPRNRVFTSAATDIVAPQEAARPARHPGSATIRDMVLGLAIHAVPLVRRLFPEFDAVAAGRFLPPPRSFPTA